MMKFRSLGFWLLYIFFIALFSVVLGVSIQSVGTIALSDKTGSVNNNVTPIPSVSDSLSPGDTQLYRVKRVIDGDTIELENGDKVRYIGINTPESVDPRRPVQCFSQEAKEKNRELVEGKMVRLEKDVSEKDRYGRKLRYVYVDSLFINSELLKRGYATVSTVPPDISFQALFRDMESEARNEKRGLWSECRKY